MMSRCAPHHFHPTGKGQLLLRGKEPVPKPGLPKKPPKYLKPIPINERNAQDVLDSYLDEKSPKVAKMLYSTWTAQADGIKYQEIANAMSGRVLPQHEAWRLTMEWMERFHRQYAEYVESTLIPAWSIAMYYGGKAIEDSINESAILRTGFTQTPTGQQVQEWVQTRGAQWVTAVSESQKNAIQAMLTYYTTERPVHPDELARFLRPAVGLTKGQAMAVTRYREQLRMKRLKEEEKRLGRPLTEDEKMAFPYSDKDERQVANYWGRLHRLRAQRIAETELSFAVHRGQQRAIEDAVDQDWFDGPVVKVWMTAEDERTCRHCGGLNDTVVGLKDEWSGQSSKESSVPTPPAHPKCRCTVAYQVWPEDQPLPVSGTAPKPGKEKPLLDGDVDSWKADAGKWREKLAVETNIDKAAVDIVAKGKLDTDEDFRNLADHWIYGMDPGEARVSSEKDCVRMSERLIHQWNGTSAGTPRAIAVQFAVHEEFGIGNIDHFSPGMVETAKQEYLKHGKALRKYVRAQYEVTQEYFKEKGIKKIRIVRGFTWNHGQTVPGYVNDLPPGTAVRTKIPMQPISSCCASRVDTAKEFAEAGRQGIVIAADVPVEHIFSTGITGFGTDYETEAVLLASHDDFVALRAVDRHTSTPGGMSAYREADIIDKLLEGANQ